MHRRIQHIQLPRVIVCSLTLSLVGCASQPRASTADLGLDDQLGIFAAAVQGVMNEAEWTVKDLRLRAVLSSLIVATATPIVRRWSFSRSSPTYSALLCYVI